MKIDNSSTSFNDSTAYFIGVPLTKSKTPNPLSKKAPDLLRYAINQKDDYCPGIDKCVFDCLTIGDAGNVSIKEMEKTLKNRGSKTIFLLGGEHTITKHAVNALLSAKEDFELVVFDAHLDMRKGFPTNACFMAELVKSMPKDSIHLFCQREYSEDEFKFKQGVKIEHLPKPGLIKKKKLYISFDIDCLDDIYVPTCSTPEPLGISIENAALILADLFKNNEIIGIDFVEFSGKSFDITYSNVAYLVMVCLKAMLEKTV